MADILSQNEVDALLSAISTDEPEAPEEEEHGGFDASGNERKVVAKYDFRRPDIVSKDQMRTLQSLHKTFCRFLTTNLSTYLRTIVEVNLVAVDQLTYGEFNMSLSNPTWINTFTLSPLQGSAVLEINPVLVYSMIDRMLGGPGNPPPEIKPLTDIEQSIMSQVMELFLDGLQEAWKNIVRFDLMIKDKEVNPQFVQIVAPGETVILVSCEMKVGNISGIISICLPFLYIEPIMSSLSSQHWISATQKPATEMSRSSLQGRLEKTYLDIEAFLGNAALNIREMLALRKGDVLILESKISEPVLVKIQGKKKFVGVPGILGKKKCVQLKEPIKEDGGADHGRRRSN